MGKYRKKPVEIEAIQLTEELALECLDTRKPGPFGLQVNGRWHPERGELMRKVWTPTPFMVDAFTGSVSDDRRYKRKVYWAAKASGSASEKKQ